MSVWKAAPRYRDAMRHGAGTAAARRRDRRRKADAARADDDPSLVWNLFRGSTGY